MVGKSSERFHRISGHPLSHSHSNRRMGHSLNHRSHGRRTGCRHVSGWDFPFAGAQIRLGSNEALRKRLDFTRGRPAKDLVAELTCGVRARYKDGHDVTTASGHRLEVKLSRLNHPGSSRTLRWTWDNLPGHQGTKEYHFLVLTGEEDPRAPVAVP